MTEILPDANGDRLGLVRVGLRQALLICSHVAILCISLVEVADFFHPMGYVMFDAAGAHVTLACATAFAVLSIAFLIAPFIFRAIFWNYLYTMICSYLWLLQFSRLSFSITAPAGVSIFASALAFLAPSLLIKSPIRQRLVLSEPALNAALYAILAIGFVIVAIGATYNFRLASFSEMNSLREQVRFPSALGYAIGAMSSVLLPFAFACFVARHRPWLAGTALLLLLLFYPVTLTKLTLAAPLWLPCIRYYAVVCNARTSVILSLLMPALAGIRVDFVV